MRSLAEYAYVILCIFNIIVAFINVWVVIRKIRARRIANSSINNARHNAIFTKHEPPPPGWGCNNTYKFSLTNNNNAMYDQESEEEANKMRLSVK